MKLPPTTVLAAALGLAALAQADAIDSQALAVRARRIVDAAIAATGGLDRLRRIESLLVDEVGTHQWVYQSRRATPPWRQGQRDELTVVDRRSSRLLIRTRVTHPDYYFGWPGTIVTGTTGYTLDHHSRMAVPLTNTSLDAYRAHLYQRLPHEVLLDAAARAVSLRSMGRATVAGRPHEVVSYVSFDARQTTLFVDADTRLLTQFEVVITNPVEGDGVTGVRFAGYRPTNGVMVPRSREQYRGREWVIRTEYRDLQIDQTIAADMFTVPSGFETVAVSPTPTPEVIDVGEGLFFVRGLSASGRYNMMFVSFGDHLVAVNAPTPVAATEQAISLVEKKAPRLPIRSVVLTHPAYDHVAGVRAFVARGATVLARPQTRVLVDRVLKAAFVLEPDTFAQAPRPALFDAVDRRRTLTNGQQEMQLIDIGPDETGDDVLVVYFPRARLLFQADLVNPNYAGTLGTAQPATIMLERRLTELGLDVERLAGGHGGVIDRSVVRRAVERATAAGSK